jgi:integrase
MAIRALNRLTGRQVDTLGDGSWSDGGNLRLYVSNEGRGRSWVFSFTSPATGKVREMGLGRAGQGGVSLAQAREERDRLRALLRDGLDPLDQRRRNWEAAAGKKSFIEVARLTLAKKVGGFKNGVDGSSYQQWRRTIDRDTRSLHSLAIDQITVDHVKRVVSPMWDKSHHETARGTLGRIEAIFGYACAHGWRSDNPASWSTFKFICPDGPPVKPHPMLPPSEVPEFMARLRQSRSMTALALEYTILTAARLSEVRLAEFREVDLDRAIWTVPGSRMKRRLEHAVPLPTRALAIVAELRRLRPAARYIFPSHDGSPMSKQGLWALCCRMSDDQASPHGFRASIRSWMADKGVAFEVAESILAHSSNSTVAAYQRSNLIERKRPVLQAWCDYLDGKEPASATIIPLGVARL